MIFGFIGGSGSGSTPMVFDRVRIFVLVVVVARGSTGGFESIKPRLWENSG